MINGSSNPILQRLSSEDRNGLTYKHQNDTEGNYFLADCFKNIFKSSSREVKPNGEVVSTVSAKLSLLIGKNAATRRQITSTLAERRMKCIENILTTTGYQFLKNAQDVSPNEKGEYTREILKNSLDLLRYDLLEDRERMLGNITVSQASKRIVADLAANIDVKKTTKIASSDFVVSLGAVIRGATTPKEMKFIDQAIKLAFRDGTISYKQYEYLKDLFISEVYQNISSVVSYHNGAEYCISKLIFLNDYKDILDSHAHRYGRARNAIKYKIDHKHEKFIRVLKNTNHILKDTIKTDKARMEDCAKNAKKENTTSTMHELSSSITAIAKILLAKRIIGTTEVADYITQYSILHDLYYDNFNARIDTYQGIPEELETLNKLIATHNALADRNEDIFILPLNDLIKLLPAPIVTPDNSNNPFVLGNFDEINQKQSLNDQARISAIGDSMSHRLHRLLAPILDDSRPQARISDADDYISHQHHHQRQFVPIFDDSQAQARMPDADDYISPRPHHQRQFVPIFDDSQAQARMPDAADYISPRPHRQRQLSPTYSGYQPISRDNYISASTRERQHQHQVTVDTFQKMEALILQQQIELEDRQKVQSGVYSSLHTDPVLLIQQCQIQLNLLYSRIFDLTDEKNGIVENNIKLEIVLSQTATEIKKLRSDIRAGYPPVNLEDQITEIEDIVTSVEKEAALYHLHNPIGFRVI